MHDYLQIIGVARDASYREVRRLAARRVRHSHPDFGDRSTPPLPAALAGRFGTGTDAAVDFLSMTPIVERMQAGFFGRRESPPPGR